MYLTDNLTARLASENPYHVVELVILRGECIVRSCQLYQSKLYGYNLYERPQS